jgi:hypothetical protein
MAVVIKPTYAKFAAILDLLIPELFKAGELTFDLLKLADEGLMLAEETFLFKEANGGALSIFMSFKVE